MERARASDRNTVRCFVGLPLPEAWQRGLDDLCGGLARALASRIGWTKPGNWHVTLKFLGEVDEARLGELCAALAQVEFAPFSFRLGMAGSFGQRGAPRTLWAGLAQGAQECARLAAGVERALGPLGFVPEGREYRPHVTLGRVRRAAPGDGWEQAGQAVSQALGGPGFASGCAGEFVLWRSILGPQGPKYLALRNFPARDRGRPDGGKDAPR
ncbi:MAG: RNA 2',3'-cyclic phosphodiesterase [Desulfovibrio sp.]|jgi:2'-5' RNA ligase|nr:RNA 2',3'-cyclic phosphodiesterase [Desulfovibrio sp.]